MTRLLLAIAALVAVLVLAMATLGDDGNYAAERTAQVQAQEAARTERTARPVPEDEELDAVRRRLDASLQRSAELQRCLLKRNYFEIEQHVRRRKATE